MTKIKLTDGTIINASDIKLVDGILKISTTDSTVEKLAKLFSNKEKISLLTLMTESGIECGYKSGFTSFAGINFDPDGTKTIELFQPADATEARIAKIEASAAMANAKTSELEGQNAAMATTINNILTDLAPKEPEAEPETEAEVPENE